MVRYEADGSAASLSAIVGFLVLPPAAPAPRLSTYLGIELNSSMVRYEADGSAASLSAVEGLLVLPPAAPAFRLLVEL